MRGDCPGGNLHKLLIAICAVGTLGVGSLAAQERERQDQPSRPVAVPDTSNGSGNVTYFAATEAGFDSNLDNLVARRGSPFELMQFGASGAYKPTDSSAYSFYLSGRDFWYNDLAPAQRYDVDAAAGARYDL